jgi:fructuronate reductase
VSEGRRRETGAAATSAGVVHLGAGAFARAHTWWGTAGAVDADPGPWGVVAVAQRSSRVVDALRRHDWAYDLDLVDGDQRTGYRVRVVRDGFVAADEPDRLTETLAAESTRVVTVTATEAGYPTDPGTGGLDVRAPGVAADLGGGPPSTLPGQLAHAAAERVRRGLPALSVVVCDNVHDGGPLLRRLSVELASGLGETAAAQALSEQWAFPRTVVDRVVPAVPADREPDLVAEPWFRWVLEDRFAGARPAWEGAGARVVPDVGPWQAAKLLLLNAPHSLLAYLGLARGHRTIDAAVADPVLRGVLDAALATELVPCVPAADGLDPDAEAASAVRRFANPATGHRLAQVGADGSLKLPQRFAATVARSRAGDGDARWAALTVACWAHAVQRGQVEDPRAADVADALAGRRPGPALLDLARLGTEAPDDPVAADLDRWLHRIETDGLAEAVHA